MIVLVILGLCAIAVVAFIVVCNLIVGLNPMHKVDLKADDGMKYNLLVLGAPTRRRNGTINPYLTNRLDKAIEAYKLGKADKVVISGKDSKPTSEIRFMKDYLLKEGVDEGDIIEDGNGTNTKASVLFCKAMHLENVAIVTQAFHAQRACYISRKAGKPCSVLPAGDVHDGNLLKVHTREALSRCKAVIN